MSTISNNLCPNSVYFVYFKEWEISYVYMIYNMVAINKESEYFIISVLPVIIFFYPHLPI